MKIMVEYGNLKAINGTIERQAFTYEQHEPLEVTVHHTKRIIKKGQCTHAAIWIEQPNNMWGMYALITKEDIRT